MHTDREKFLQKIGWGPYYVAKYYREKAFNRVEEMENGLNTAGRVKELLKAEAALADVMREYPDAILYARAKDMANSAKATVRAAGEKAVAAMEAGANPTEALQAALQESGQE